jgi:peptidoglycan/xylan/chitin deacetylase (PgdA/CDA1 family)
MPILGFFIDPQQRNIEKAGDSMTSHRNGTVTSLRRALGWSAGLTNWPLCHLQKHLQSAVVVLYHRVSPTPDPFYEPTHPERFRQHLAQLKKTYSLVHLDELVSRFMNGKSLRGCCAITFDDGFEDFALHAYPILYELGIPVTHFVTAEGIQNGTPTWNYRLRRVLRDFSLSKLLDLTGQKESFGCSEIAQGKYLMERLPSHERNALLETLEKNLLLPFDPLMLNANSIRQLDSALVHWGSHTVAHPSLPLCTDQELTFELAHSRHVIESIAGKPVTLLAYPNGRYDSRVMRAAANCGYRASFAVNNCRVKVNSPPHAIPRFDIGDLPNDLIGFELSGTIGMLRRLRGK